MSTRRITTLFAEVEIRLRPERRVTTAFLEVEYFPAEDHTRRLLNARFNAIRTALHAAAATGQSPDESNFSTEITAYKNDIETAFGVRFLSDPSASSWNLVRLHFARKGLEAVAYRFKAWAEDNLSGPYMGLNVDRYALFRRIFGGLSNPIQLINRATPKNYVAETSLHIIEIWYHPTLPRNWIMTPNNLIHELGHSISRLACFGTSESNNNAGRGSMEWAIRQRGLPYTEYRITGMGDNFLQQYFASIPSAQYYEHSRIIRADSGAALFDSEPLGSKPPTITTPAQREQYFLLYDLLQEDHFVLWGDLNYHPFGLNTRIDFHVQNNASTALETSADVFLNWVNDKLIRLSSDDPNWSQLFTPYAGIMLRNAAMYTNGSLQHYQAKALVSAPVTAGTLQEGNRYLRLTAAEPDPAIERNILNNDEQSGSLGAIGTSIPIYGCATRTPPPGNSNNSPFWLLIADSQNRLVWVASDAISLPAGFDQCPTITNPEAFYLDAVYQAQDLSTVLGY